jgi:hypothetical protein
MTTIRQIWAIYAAHTSFTFQASQMLLRFKSSIGEMRRKYDTTYLNI